MVQEGTSQKLEERVFLTVDLAELSKKPKAFPAILTVPLILG